MSLQQVETAVSQLPLADLHLGLAATFRARVVDCFVRRSQPGPGEHAVPPNQTATVPDVVESGPRCGWPRILGFPEQIASGAG